MSDEQDRLKWRRGVAEFRTDCSAWAAWGFAEHTLKHLQKIVRENSDLLLEAWKDYEGED